MAILVGTIALIGAVVLLSRLTPQSNTGGNGPAVNSSDLSGQETPLPADQNKDLAQPEASPSVQKEEYTASPSMQINTKKSYLAVLNTSEGSISVQLNPKMTPITVNNFVFLAKKHFYDNTVIHRVIKDFMIQGGDPKGDGTGGPGYKFNDEKFSGEYSRGTIAMANSGPNTNGSQFFIMHQDNLSMPKNYVIFGKVMSGLDVLDMIAAAPVGPGEMGEMSKPLQPVVIKSVEIIEK